MGEVSKWLQNKIAFHAQLGYAPSIVYNKLHKVPRP